jgi:quinol monooxygenase YgiN
MTLRTENDEGVRDVMQQLQAAEQPDSGLLRTTTMRDRNDPRSIYTLVVFESEEKARQREQDPRRGEALASVRTAMADLFEGAPEFTDMTVVYEA